MITVTTPCQDIKPNTFMIEGKYDESVSFPTTMFIKLAFKKDMLKGL